MDLRKLEGVGQNLTLPAERGEVRVFLTNPENAQRVNSLVEDIFDTLLEYQVCALAYLFPIMSDICPRLHCNRIFMMRIASS